MTPLCSLHNVFAEKCQILPQVSQQAKLSFFLTWCLLCQIIGSLVGDSLFQFSVSLLDKQPPDSNHHVPILSTPSSSAINERQTTARRSCLCPCPPTTWQVLLSNWIETTSTAGGRAFPAGTAQVSPTALELKHFRHGWERERWKLLFSLPSLLSLTEMAVVLGQFLLLEIVVSRFFWLV